MGCGRSKQSRCSHCESAYTPVPRSYSMGVHHPSQWKGDSYHMVALTSSTLGSLNLDPSSIDENLHQSTHVHEDAEKKLGVENGDEFSMGLIEAKIWSDMINEKIPKMISPPGEPETINAWELMEGLEESSPLRPFNHLRGFSVDVISNRIHDSFNLPMPKVLENGVELESHKAITPPLMENDSKLFGFQTPDIFSNSVKSDTKPFDSTKLKEITTPFAKNKVVVYFTSLRGVRKTYEDCCHVRAILKRLDLRLDERDVSMDSGFKDELKELLGDKINVDGLNLPRVFLGRKYIGGAEDIRRMHEYGQLEKIFDCCQKVNDEEYEYGFYRSRVCEACGDIRFVPCETCSGSCKVYYEGGLCDDESEEEVGNDEIGFRRCLECNENGLIRCPLCCE